MKISSPDTARGRSAGSLETSVAQAVRNSLNLPRLRVEVRRSTARHNTAGCWMVSLKQRGSRSEWLELDTTAIAVARKVGLLPPRLLGMFRLAYDAMNNRQSGVSNE